MESFDFPSHFLYKVSLDVDAPFRSQVHGHNDRLSLNRLWSRLIGTWQLVSYYAFAEDDPDDKAYPLGHDAQGILVYTADGYMSTNLLRPGQEPFLSAGSEDASQSELAEATKRYLGYSGPFYVAKAGDTFAIYHQMLIVNFPNWKGNLQTRRIRLEGDMLTLALESVVDGDGVKRQPIFTWTKMLKNDATMGC